MGEGSWQTLCGHMDALIITHHYHDADFTREDLAHKHQAEDLLREFVRRTKEETQ